MTVHGVLESDRYTIEERIGSGGMGVVYRAHDRVLGCDVALKMLRGATPAALLGLRGEFRALAGIVHPHLVTLYELEVTPEHQGFFTMELIRGTSLLDHVRPLTPGAGPAGPRVLDERRLRASLAQLVSGLGALHAARKLHCDIKPFNVMVNDEGQVVILDFGLVVELDARDPRRPGDAIFGTPMYMSPEQAAGASLTAASDCYSLGALLYEALTGEPPFRGTVREILRIKRTEQPPRPELVAPDVPRDLAALCTRLMQPRAIRRPTLDEVLEILGEAPQPPVAPTPALPRAFIGRERESAALRAAFDEVQGGHTATVFVYGVSGIGKSTLVTHFLDEIEQRGGAIVLRGRCYERESMPYKALDSVVDGLARHLARLPPGEAALVFPPEAYLLARVFPTLVRPGVPSFDAPEEARSMDPREVRRRAFAALRELLRRLGRRAPLVLAIDDLQWGDVDSAALFTEIFWSREPPTGLLLLSFRAEDRGTSPLLRMLLEPGDAAAPARSTHTIEVGPLSDDESRDLTRALLAQRPDAHGAVTDAVAREAAGSPFFVHEMVAHALSGDGAGRASPGTIPRYDEILSARMARLGDGARRLLEAVAVAGYPIEEQVAALAAELPAGSRPALEALRAAQLVLTRGTARASLVEAYHDRIREAVVERIPEETRRGFHLRLAEVVLATPGPDPQRLVDHYLSAGRPERAAHFAVPAADRAAEALAFNRAASLYRLAVDHGAGDDASLLYTKLGEALSSAGKSADAAGNFERAAEALGAGGSAPPRALELKRQASEEYLRSGLVDDGLRVLREVLQAVGTRYPETTTEAVASILVNRAELRLRRPRAHAETSGADRARLEAYWSAGLGLSMVDTTRSAVFQVRHQLLALRTGDPLHLSRARATQAAFAASEGGHGNQRRCATLIKEAHRIAGDLGDPSLSGLVTLCDGVVAYFCGAFRTAVERCATAERTCRERGRGLAWEITNTQIYGLWGLAYLGRITELTQRLPVALKEARERGDVFAATTLRLGFPNIVWLAADRPEEAHEQAADAMRIWTRGGFHSQHYFELVARAHVDLYRGDGAAAWRRVTSIWRALESAFLLRLESVRVELCHLRARCALAALAAATGEGDDSASTDPGGPALDRGQLLEIVRRDARAIAAERSLLAAPLEGTLTAGIAASSGRVEDAATALDRAARGFDGLHMALYAASARRISGVLTGGAEGRAARDAADAWMRAEGIAAPARMAAMLIPGVTRAG